MAGAGDAIGAGASNLTYLLERSARAWCCAARRRRRCRVAHDVVREARIHMALAPAGVRVPEILAFARTRASWSAVLPDGELQDALISEELPAAIDAPEERRRLADEFLDGLVQLHAIDWPALGLQIGKPRLLDRQLRAGAAVGGQRDARARRVRRARRAAARVHARSAPATVVQWRLPPGNVMVADHPPARLVAILDWEMATIGDPLADLGYLIATWSQPGSRITRCC